MSCIPQSGGCERHRTDPFVEYLNEVEGSRFRHEQCLDRAFRNSKQPEALYADARSGADLVIERKSILWPPTYAARHQNDHRVADVLTEELRDLADDHPLTIQLGHTPRMRRAALEATAREIAHAVRSGFDAILKGQSIHSPPGGCPWRARLDAEDRLDFGHPPTGLLLIWSEPRRTVSPDDLPSGLVDRIAKAFRGTVQKFEGYPNARGILVLDQYGWIRYCGPDWWSQVFEHIPVPDSLPEVWLGLDDWVSDFERGWVFEKLHPRAGLEGGLRW